MFFKCLAIGLLCAAALAKRDSYDYVIVGGGTAGLALATRLSQGLPHADILVVEAGPAAPDELRINVPGLRGSGLGTIYDWNFTSVPQPNLQGRPIDVNRGKVLGGSSALNYLCYDRAAAAEYDAWGKLANGDRWSWETMIAAMTKSENFTGADDGDRHGHAGPIRNTYNRVIPKILDTWRPAMSKLGVPGNEGGSLGGNPIGVMFQPTNIDVTHWNRSYSASSYLPLAGLNLEVKAGIRVTKVEFAKKPRDQEPLRAVGVILEDGTRIAAREEVILSAGSIQSPGLLELSGIGQPQVLKAAGITQLLDLPGVGENYQDHIRVSNTYRLKANFSSFDPLIYQSSGAFAKKQLQLWLDGKDSWYDYTSIAYSFLNWDQATGGNSSSSKADLIRLAEQSLDNSTRTVVDKQKIAFLRDPSIPQLEMIMEANYVSATAYPGGSDDAPRFFTLISSLMHPMSRGSVHIDPADPLGRPPVIDPRYLSSEYDAAALVAGAKFARRVALQEPMASVWEAEFEPGPGLSSDGDEKAWRDWVSKTMLSFFHPVGTCAMLPREDGGVVGPEMLVHGTANLRVVDCSVIPVLLSAHLQTAAYGIAEIAAEMIISDSKR